MARRTQRPQPDDLRTTQVRTAARGFDRFFLARGPRVSRDTGLPSAQDFANLVGTLASAFAPTQEETQEERAESQVLVGQIFQEAAEGKKTLRQTAAAAMADGRWLQEFNPNQILAMGPNVAVRLGAAYEEEQRAKISRFALEDGSILPPNLGTYQEMATAGRENLRDLVGDSPIAQSPAFRAALNNVLFAADSRLRTAFEARRLKINSTAHTNAVVVEMHDRFRGLANKALSGEDITEDVADLNNYTQNSVVGVINQPHRTTYFQAAQTAILGIADEKGLEAALDAYRVLREVSIGNIPMGKGPMGPQWQALEEHLSDEADEDERRAESRDARERRGVLRAVEGLPAFQNIYTLETIGERRRAADNLIAEFTKNPEQFLNGKTDMFNDVLQLIRSAATEQSIVLLERDKQISSQINDLLALGKIDEAQSLSIGLRVEGSRAEAEKVIAKAIEDSGRSIGRGSIYQSVEDEADKTTLAARAALPPDVGRALQEAVDERLDVFREQYVEKTRGQAQAQLAQLSPELNEMRREATRDIQDLIRTRVTEAGEATSHWATEILTNARPFDALIAGIQADGRLTPDQKASSITAAYRQQAVVAKHVETARRIVVPILESELSDADLDTVNGGFFIPDPRDPNPLTSKRVVTRKTSAAIERALVSFQAWVSSPEFRETDIRGKMSDLIHTELGTTTAPDPDDPARIELTDAHETILSSLMGSRETAEFRGNLTALILKGTGEVQDIELQLRRDAGNLGFDFEAGERLAVTSLDRGITASRSAHFPGGPSISSAVQASEDFLFHPAITLHALMAVSDGGDGRLAAPRFVNERLRQLHQRNADRVVSAVFRDESATPEQKEAAFLNGFRGFHIPYTMILSGELSTTEGSIPLTRIDAIDWRATPLFSNTAELSQVMESAQATEFLRLLNVSASRKTEFISAQIKVLNRVNL